MSKCVYLPNKPESNGYVRVGRARPGRERSAHRAAFVEAYGAIPENYVVNHICHDEDLTCAGGNTCKHRACVNPEHLEAVPSRENILSSHSHPAAKNSHKTHCPSGHEYTEANTYTTPTKGDRQCRMCKLIWRQLDIRRRKALEWGLGDVGTFELVGEAG